MDFKGPKPNEVASVRITDIKKFFVNYIVSDNLGMIANAHLARADISEQGAADGKCIRLAQLHSDAVGMYTGRALFVSVYRCAGRYFSRL